MNPEHVSAMANAQQRLELLQLHKPEWEHLAALAAARPQWRTRVAARLRRIRLSRPREAAPAVARAR